MRLAATGALLSFALSLCTAVPAQQAYTPFGVGCVGSNGVPVLDAGPGSLPRIDRTFTLQLSNLPPDTPGTFVAFGFSKIDWLGIALPADLTPFGIWGCTAYVSVLNSFPVATQAGAGQFQLAIPNDSSIVGVHFFNQGLILDPGINPAGAVVSNAAEGVIGPRGIDPPTYDVTGSWTITETSGTNDCGDPVGVEVVYSVTATLNGNDLSLSTPTGTFEGTVIGDAIEWTGSFPEQGGTTTIEATSITATDVDHFSGTIQWSWTDGVYPCSGTNTISGVRQ